MKKYFIKFDQRIATTHGDGTDYSYKNKQYDFNDINVAQDCWNDMLEDEDNSNMIRNF
jgi:hypothetical protein